MFASTCLWAATRLAATAKAKFGDEPGGANHEFQTLTHGPRIGPRTMIF